ncbi:MAG TPA: hypothetical protein VGE39_21900, partial [Prosthecobacter sp.]
ARVLALREMSQFWPLDTINGPLPHFKYAGAGPDTMKPLQMIAAEEKSSLVRLTFASLLQRLPLEERAPLAGILLANKEDANDPFLPYLVWYGISPLVKPYPETLVNLAQHCHWPKTLRWIARSLATHPEALDLLLARLHAPEPGSSPSSTPAQITAILEGIADAFKGIRKAPKPANWEAIAQSKGAQDPANATLLRDLSILFGDGRALDDVKKLVLDDKAELSDREAALKTLIEARPADLHAVCTQLLEVRGLNVTAARGLALSGDPATAAQLAKAYRKFSSADRPALIDVLVARPAFAKELLQEIAAGRIPRADLSAFHARQIRAFNDDALTRELVATWGELRESAADKKELIEKMKKQLTPAVLAQANLPQGRTLFTALCGACHMMYGEGGKIGPDLTGSGRANLDYLLENIADPSGVVSADYRVSVITLKDGRTLSGVIAASNDRTLTLKTLTESTTLDKAEITKTETSPLSMMPEGLLLALPPEAVKDLIAYLMHPSQVPLPKAP